MMKVRAILLLVLLGAAGGAAFWAQQRGHLFEPEQVVFDFLFANARTGFDSAPSLPSKVVVVVEFNAAEKAEYSAWPPAPLDYEMALQRIALHRPEVVAIADVLRWDQAQPQIVSKLRDTLLAFPGLVLGFDLSPREGAGGEESAKFIAEEMPSLPAKEDAMAAGKYPSVTRLPERSIRIRGQMGFVNLEGRDQKDSLPMAVQCGQKLAPSLAAQAITLYRRAPYAHQRLRFGAGARLSLGDTMVVPLDSRGDIILKDVPPPQQVNALDLLTPDLGDASSQALKETLGQGKAVVLTVRDAEGRSPGALHALAITRALSMPTLHREGLAVEWGVAGLTVLLSLWQLRFGRFGAMLFGAVVIAGIMAADLLAFQSALRWWSPLAALTVILTSTVFCFLWPHRVSAKSSETKIVSA